MKIFLLFGFILVSLLQTDLVGGNSGVQIQVEISSPATELATSTEPPIQASTCPEPSLISPCTCSSSSEKLKITCSGSAVTQTTIESAFAEIRKVNGISEDRGISINEFTLTSTNLTELDLAPFYGSGLASLYMRYNHNLTKLVTSGNPEVARGHGSIRVTEWLQVYESPITREGFGDALRYFSNDMTYLSVAQLPLDDDDNNNQADDDEFLPGFSALTNLRTLAFQHCNISGPLTTESWNFQGAPRLQSINFFHNNITEIGENVFHLPDNKNDLLITLQSNELNETSFHPESGIAQTGRKTILDLKFNQFTTLPAQIFQAFLDANPKNSVELIENPLICDDRLSWLKSRRAEFQSRVFPPKCTNDPDHTLWDSDLIP